ncbi:hypothetical protein WJX84_004517 [Apatococcus fuscideae]|uniref:Exocyst complex component Sec8 n=1 Tax=Apatococcus fuscideae TaxID=2026836 RepID=A0AAW1SWX5_9CHLO
MPRRQTSDDYDPLPRQQSAAIGRQASQQIGFGRQGRVDWNSVDDVLDSIPSEFKDPRFDSLQHVLSTLSSVNAESALEKLRDQRQVVEETVDDIVQGYHSGFNKAIHNYSQILRLFSDAKSQVEILRTSLTEARGRLGSQSRHLQQQWRRSVTLGDIVRLLGDLQSVVGVPARVQELEEAKDWIPAVALLVDACSKISRQEVAKVGALRDIKSELAVRRDALQQGIVAQIEAQVYSPAARTGHRGGLGDEDDDNGADEDRASSPHNSVHHARIMSTEAVLANFDPTKESNGSRSSRMRAGKAKSSPGHRRAGSMADEDGRSAFHRRKSSLAASPSSKAAKVAAPLHVLVDCIAQLGGIAEAQNSIHNSMPNQVKSLVQRALQSAPVTTIPVADRQPLPSTSMAVPGSIAAAAQRVMSHVFDACLQVLRNMSNMLRMLAAAKPPAMSAGLEALMQQQQGSGTTSNRPAAMTSPAAVRRETEAVWECMQRECQRLLVLILHATSGGSPTKNPDPQLLPGAGWLQSMMDRDGRKQPRDPGQLTFSFDLQLGSLAAGPQEQLGSEAAGGQWHANMLEDPDGISRLRAE